MEWINQVIEITKEQMMYIKKYSPNTRFTITNLQASKGKKKQRYVEETDVVKNLLNQYSTDIEKVTYTYGKV